ncbi:hypothetical protein NG783_10555 [Aliarcobacter cryaerophilus]|uniref:hypothetical protein n=1 Tax=Aliarcobacter cryaerophilus TaxID=28198 RepID=UPI003DA262CB
MLKKDIEKMSFGDLINLQKSLNETIFKKRNNDFGALIKELKKLKQQQKDFDKKMKKVEDIFYDLLFENKFVKNIENCNYYINNESFLHIYIYENSKTIKSLDYDFENMKIVKNNGFTEEEIEKIIEEIDLLLNSNNSDSEKKNEK